jgi:hypothetical protein
LYGPDLLTYLLTPWSRVLEKLTGSVALPVNNTVGAEIFCLLSTFCDWVKAFEAIV